MDAGERVYAHEFNGFWEDVGTVASYYRASMELVQPEPRFQLHDARWPILTRDEERPAAIVSGNAQIEDSLIANGCRIDGTVQRSILFPGVSVGRGATITDAVVMADTVIEPDARVAFLADIENLPVEMEQRAARIVLNARTGSVVLNDAVTLGPCAVAHGSLSVTVSAEPQVSQPAPFSGGQTVVTERADIQVTQQGGSLLTLKAGASLAEVVKALNAIGATPLDLIAILQAMKAAGALRAELEVI